MKAKIYRGTKETGGTCVELTTDNGIAAFATSINNNKQHELFFITLNQTKKR